MLLQVLEELARAMNGEISKTSSGRSEISKDQVRFDRTLKSNICTAIIPLLWSGSITLGRSDYKILLNYNFYIYYYGKVLFWCFIWMVISKVSAYRLKTCKQVACFHDLRFKRIIIVLDPLFLPLLSWLGISVLAEIIRWTVDQDLTGWQSRIRPSMQCRPWLFIEYWRCNLWRTPCKSWKI